MRTTHQSTAGAAGPERRRGRVRRTVASLVTTALAAAGLVALVDAPVRAAEQTTSTAVLRWGLSEEIQQIPATGCAFFTAGPPAGPASAANYTTTAGNVSVLKNGVAPTWSNKCELGAAASLGQEVVFSSGSGTVDPDTGAVSLTFTGSWSINLFGGFVQQVYSDPVVTISPDGSGDVTFQNPSGPDYVFDLATVDSANATGFTTDPPDTEFETYTPLTVSYGLPAEPELSDVVDVDDVAFEWAVSTEVQSTNPAPGTCPYLSAGQSDGTQATYQTAAGNVTILKNGAAPTWAAKCEGAPTSSIGQKIVWTSGTGTANPTTGEATINFTGQASVNFYSGSVPFTIVDPVLTVDADGDGEIVATIVGYQSSIENPGVKTPLPPVHGVVVADLTGVNVTGTGFTVTPDYGGVVYDLPPTAPAGTFPQNRTTAGWGSWPVSFVDYHMTSGLSSYWYTSGGGADPRKAPSPITFTYSDLGGDPGTSGPGDDEQVISVVVPETTGEPGEFVWSITGDGVADLGMATNQGTYLGATGELDAITVSDTRAGAPTWDISGQVSDFSNGLSGKYLGWSPTILTAGGGTLAGDDVAPGLTTGAGLTESSLLASAPSGHTSGTATIGADLDLRVPVETPAGTYTATLTITALS